MYDQDTEWAMTAVEIDDRALLEKWFAAICAAHAKHPDSWDAVREELKATAVQFDGAFDDRFVESFVVGVEGLADPLRAIAEMAELGVEELARRYPSVLERKRASVAQPGRPTDAADVTTLFWVTSAQRARLEGALGPAWHQAVLAKLDEIWPQWRMATVGDLVQVLDDHAASLLAEYGPQPGGGGEPPGVPQDASTFSWVTDDQRRKLEDGLGASWREVVRAKLDEIWPPWESADTADLVQTLDNWADTIIGENPAPTSGMPGTEGSTQPAVPVAIADAARAAIADLDGISGLSVADIEKIASQVATRVASSIEAAP